MPVSRLRPLSVEVFEWRLVPSMTGGYDRPQADCPPASPAADTRPFDQPPPPNDPCVPDKPPPAAATQPPPLPTQEFIPSQPPSRLPSGAGGLSNGTALNHSATVTAGNTSKSTDSFTATIVILETQPERNPAGADPRAARSNEVAADFARELVTLLAVAVVSRDDTGGHADALPVPAPPGRPLSADVPVAYPAAPVVSGSKSDGDETVPPPPPGVAVPSVPTVEPAPSVAAAVPGVAPVAGLLGVDVAAVESGVRDLLAHATDLAADLTTEWIDTDGTGWWTWAAGAAVVTGWAGYAAWNGQRSRKETDTTKLNVVSVGVR